MRQCPLAPACEWCRSTVNLTTREVDAGIDQRPVCVTLCARCGAADRVPRLPLGESGVRAIEHYAHCYWADRGVMAG
jgi:hypothetical protein